MTVVTRAPRGNVARKLVLLGFAAMVAACATYSDKPLDGSDIEAVLASPDRSVLVRQASSLTHPRLAPVALDFTKPLTGDEIAAIAVLANPDLRSLRAKQRVADAQVFAARLLPDPQLSAGFDRVLSPLNQGLTSAVAGSLTLDILGALATRHVNLQVAQAAAQQIRLDIAWQEWSTAGQARLLAIRLPRQRQAATLARQAATLAEQSLERALASAVRGDLKNDEVDLRRIASADAGARAFAIERDAEVTRLELNRVLGLTPQEPLDVVAAAMLPPWIPPDPSALFVAARNARLDLLALAAGYDSQQATLHRAILGQYPRLAISVNRAGDTSNVQTLGPAVTLDLPLWNRNRGAIVTARATREQLRHEFAARLHQTRADIAALVAGLRRDEQARETIGMQARELEKMTAALELAAARGDVIVSLAESSRAAVIDKRLTILALEQACAEQRLALALAIGRPLTDSIDTP